MTEPIDTRDVSVTGGGTPAATTPLVRAKMQAQLSRHTKPEVALRRELHRRGVRFHLDGKLPGLPRRSADLVWRTRKLAVFIDGCFWHGCPEHFVLPKSNSEWWNDKIQRNRTRDTATTQALIAEGWSVIRVWEHANPEIAADAIQRQLSTKAVGIHLVN